MPLNVPRYHQLPNEHEFSHILTENVWEIWVPRTDSIEWATVLSCLLSNNPSEKIVEQENWKEIIENFNPFIDAFSFSQNDTLKKFVRRCKDNIQTSIKESDNLTEEELKLKSASESLNCNIYLFTEDMKLCDQFVVNNTHPSYIIILFKSGQNKINNSFGIVENYCQKWREDAFKNVLLKTNIKQHAFENIWQIIKRSKNILIELLKSDMKDIIEELCYSPLITKKLIDAGYQTDPSKTEPDSQSAFYRALVSGNHNLCISIYHIGIFCCTEDGLSTREPSRTVIMKLQNFKKTVNYDLEKISKADKNILETNSNQHAIKTGFICSSLISLRIEVETKILEILENTRVSNPNQINDERFQIKQQREILLSIFNIYKNHSNDHFPNQNLKSYAEYKYYFDIIDVDVSLFFFDYNFKLKKKLRLHDESAYACAESTFFIFLLNHVIFNRKVRKSAYFAKLFEMSSVNTCEIPHMIRKYVLGKIELFYDVLSKIDDKYVNDKVIRKGVPDKEFNLILHEYPEIKNYFLVRRLTSYIENALSVTPQKNSEKVFVFVIERVLQVIGEFIKMDPDDDFDVKWFLSLYMPKNVRKFFHDIRKKISHFDRRGFRNKIYLEEDICLFEDIQKDIINIYNYLQPLLNIIKEKLTMYIEEKLMVSSNRMEASRNFKREFQHNIKKMVESILDTVQFFHNVYTDDLTVVFENILKHLEDQLKGKREEFTKNQTKLLQKKLKLQEEEKYFISIKKLLQPIKYLIDLFVYKFGLLVQYSIRFLEFYKTAKKILLHFKIFKKQLNLSDFIKEFEFLIKICKDFIHIVKASPNDIILNGSKNIERYFKLLNTSTIIIKEDKEKIKKYFQEKLKDDFTKKENIVQHIIEKGFTMSKKDLEKNKISYMLEDEWKIFLCHYEKKNTGKALKSLERQNPLTKLEDIFMENSVKERELKILGRRIPLSNEIQEKLGKLVKGFQNVKVGNRLCYLLDRIENLEKILIGEEVCLDLWENDKPLLVKHVFNRYVEDQHVRLATEMLIFDCMNLFGEKNDQWGKSLGLFQGIDLRNIIAHEDIIIQNICEWFDPGDLPSDVIQTVINFLEDKGLIIAILKLYRKAENNFTTFFHFLKSEGIETGLVDENYIMLEKTKKYVELLPDYRNEETE